MVRGVVEIPLTKRYVSLIDEDDAERVLQYKWHARETGSMGRTVYAASARAGLLHRFILDAPHGLVVDHRNGNGLDNRKANLRLATQHENKANVGLRRDNTSGYRGVFLKRATGRWMVSINIGADKLRKIVGPFPDRITAAHAYDDLARQYHGEFARLNFPRDGEASAREGWAPNESVAKCSNGLLHENPYVDAQKTAKRSVATLPAFRKWRATGATHE